MDSEIPCARCGARNPAEARFCAECGGPIEVSGASAQVLAGSPVVGVAAPTPEATDIVCKRCRGKNQPHTAYCQYCGARIGGEDKPETSPDSPEARAEMSAAAGKASQAAAQASPPDRTAESAVDRPPAHETGRYAPPPAAGLRARLVVIAQDGSPGREYELAEDQTDVGREAGQIRLPNDPYVSPRHARLTRREGRYFLQDLASTNGVFVRLKAPAPLVDGDLVLVGLEVLRFEVVKDADKGFGPAVDQGTHLFGSPTTPRYARLRQQTVEGVGRDIYYISRDETVIGRENGDIVFTADPFMSRRHAAVNLGGDGSFQVRDLGSSNGTFLALRQERALEDGDHVRIGQHLFRIELQTSS